MTTDESALLSYLFAGIDEEVERHHLVDLLNVEREDSGARLTPRRAGSRPDAEHQLLAD